MVLLHYHFTIIVEGNVQINQSKTSGPVVQKLDCTIHRINHNPVDKYHENRLHYPLDSDLSGNRK